MSELLEKINKPNDIKNIDKKDHAFRNFQAKQH